MEDRFLGLIEKSIQNHWDLPVFSDYNGGTFLYRDMAKEIEKLHLLFHGANIQKGDKIALIGRNSSRWGITFFGILSYGAVVVPLLHEFTPDNVCHLINHSEAKLLMAAQHTLTSLNLQLIPDIETVVQLDDFSIVKGSELVKSIHDNIEDIFLDKYPDFAPKDVKFHVEDPDELAVINYTSGTVGFSKGVMLPYRSLWSNTQFAYDHLDFIHVGDNLVSILPMAHMYGLAFEVLNCVNKGCHVHFLPRIPSPNIVVESFNKIRPTLIIAVPLIIEKVVRSRVFPVLEKPVIKFFYKMPGTRQIIKKIIFNKLNAAFGKDFSEIVIGGAAINKEVEAFLKSIKFRYTVGYGMTECGPLIAYEQWDTFKKGSVGRIVDRMEAIIDAPIEGEVGEILVRGMNNMLGYYKNPEATQAVNVSDGWLRTGDLGVLDKDGFLFIRGRNKTMLLGSNGQNIYPEEIESQLNNMPYVSESLIVSREEKDSNKLIALIYPAWDKAKEKGLSKEELHEVMRDNINQLNAKIPYYSKISEFRLRENEFEKTPKQSIRRFLYQLE